MAEYVIVHTDRRGERRILDIRLDNSLANVQEVAAQLEADAHGYGRGRDRYQAYELHPAGEPRPAAELPFHPIHAPAAVTKVYVQTALDEVIRMATEVRDQVVADLSGEHPFDGLRKAVKRPWPGSKRTGAT